MSKLLERRSNNNTSNRYSQNKGWSITDATTSVIRATEKAWKINDLRENYINPVTGDVETKAMQTFFMQKDGTFIFAPLYGRQQLYEVTLLDSNNKPMRNEENEFEKDYILFEDVPKDGKEKLMKEFVNEVRQGEWNTILTNMQFVKKEEMKSKRSDGNASSMSGEQAANDWVDQINAK